MSKSVGLGRVMAAVGLAGALAAASVDAAYADETVKIGEVAPVTGPASYLGKDTENGARLAVEEINEKGLVVGGKKVVLALDAQDDAGDPRQATQVAQKLVDDGVVAVVGHMNSGTTIPASKIYSDAGVAQVSPSATNPAYTLQGFKTAYRVVATDAQQGPCTGRLCEEDAQGKDRGDRRRCHGLRAGASRRIREAREGRRHRRDVARCD